MILFFMEKFLNCISHLKKKGRTRKKNKIIDIHGVYAHIFNIAAKSNIFYR